MAPRAVLVVVLEAQHDIPALRVLDRPAQAVHRALDPVAMRQPGMALTAERAAERRADADGQIDRRPLPLDLTRSFGRIGMREVRREAEHRAHLASLA